MQEHVFVVRVFTADPAQDVMVLLAEMLASHKCQAVVEHAHTAERVLITPIAGMTVAN